MGVIRYIIKLLDVPKPNIDFITSDPDSLGLIPTILKRTNSYYSKGSFSCISHLCS